MRPLFVAFVSLFSVGCGCALVDSGQVGVSYSMGKIDPEPLPPGVYVSLPVVRYVSRWNVKTQEHEEQTQVPSSEGMIVGLDASILYHVNPQDAPKLRMTVGENYLETIIVPFVRNAVRDTVAGYPIQSVFSTSGREEIASKIQSRLAEELAPRGIAVEAVLLRDVRLPETFSKSVEAKLAAQQKAEQKKFELEQAHRDAEIEVARAEGAAKAQAIINSTLTDAYLHYLWIETLKGNPNVVYVATEAGLPLFKGVK
jgi:regulator of protease activity HflC (stomatin/prohibitin superfamily)